MSTQQTIPICNGSRNGIQYYTPTPGQDVGNAIGGFSGIVSSVISSIFFTILGSIAFASRGGDIITSIFSIFIICSSISIISNYINMTRKPDGYTENCQKNEVLSIN